MLLMEAGSCSLKHKLAEMLGFFDVSARCIYVDYPLHSNVGDLLINRGSEQFFADHHLRIWRRYNYYDFTNEIPGLTDKDVFLLHGGGNFGDLWFNFQSFRERLIAQFPNNRVIFLPQTVHFSTYEKARASVAAINRHGNCHVFARDFRSLEFLQHLRLRSVSAMPDTAHALTGVLLPIRTKAAGGSLGLIRTDKEASRTPQQLMSSLDITCDWDDGVFGKARELIHHGVVNFVKGVGRYGPNIDCHQLWYWHRDKLIADSVEIFSRYDSVVTNRLHGMILGLLLDRKVSAFDNSYGKLSSYYDSWLTNEQLVSFDRPTSATSGAEAFAA